MTIKNEILISASLGLGWLQIQNPESIKDISRSIQALSEWNEPSSHLIEKLLSIKKDRFRESKTPVLDTARACSALYSCGNVQPEILRWIQEGQKNDNWNNNEIDTAYALSALSDCGIENENGCQWLIHEYGKKPKHPGTTALVIMALFKQNKNRYRDFIKERAVWLLSKRESGGWIHIATSNLVIQALILSGTGDEASSIKWLIEKQQKNGCWKDITSTSLSLISLKMYLDKLNSGSGK